MSDVLIILCTFPSTAQARQIGTLLVGRQLAACVNLIPGVESIYRWQGKVESATEALAIFKTSTETYPTFERILVELKPSEIAEPYRSWTLNNVTY